MSGDNAKQEMRRQGVGVSPGAARGTLYVVEDDRDDVVKHRIEAAQIPNEIGRFETALIQTRSQILEMQERIAQSKAAYAGASATRRGNRATTLADDDAL